MKTKTAKKKKSAPSKAGRPTGPRDSELESVMNEMTTKPAEAMELIEELLSLSCPYCGEEFEIQVTSEEDGQTKYEDCSVCCRPISIHIHMEEGELHAEAHRS